MIRKAKPEDFEIVRDLLVAADITTAEFFSKERYEASVATWSKYYLVEEREGKVVGFISGFDDGGNFYGYMGRLVVDPSYRQQGIGEALTRACLQEFREAKLPIIYAGVSLVNEASNNLLKKIGFVDEGYRLVYFDTKVA